MTWKYKLTEIIRQGKLNGKQRNRLKSLLDMMYRPSELSEEIGITRNQIYRVYIPLGCPHIQDEHNHYWVNGKPIDTHRDIAWQWS